MNSIISIEQLPEFRGCYNARTSADAARRSREAYFLYHGFPGNRGMRNQDLAEEICFRSGQDCYILHYRGLGRSSGKFSFVSSVRDSVEFTLATAATGGYETVNLFGHSWGGLVAMNCARALEPSAAKLGKLFLLAPFNRIPPHEHLQSTMGAILAGATVEFEAATPDDAVLELETLRQEHDPRAIAAAMQWKEKQVAIIQSLNDHEVPEQTTREFAELFRGTASYREVEMDHSFIDQREKAVAMIVEALSLT